MVVGECSAPATVMCLTNDLRAAKLLIVFNLILIDCDK
jgi:hypothetical protein